MSDAELKRFRAEKDRVFARDPHSPLTPEQRRSFHGLAYFDENPGLVIHASIDRKVEPGEVPMATTGGQEQVYRRYGLVRFRVDDQPTQVVLYASDDSDELFGIRQRRRDDRDNDRRFTLAHIELEHRIRLGGW